MATTKQAYKAAAATALGITLASLANGAARESATVDNTADLALDVLVQAKVTLAAGTAGSDQAVYVYAWGVIDATTPTYPDAVTGADAAITPQNPTQLAWLGTIYAPANAGATSTWKMNPKSLASLFGGVVPQKWGLVVINKTGVAFDATAGNFAITYQIINATSQ